MSKKGKKISVVVMVLLFSWTIPFITSFHQSDDLKESVDLAHLPRIIEQEQTIKVIDPEISQAFYGQLQGNPVRYEIHADVDFLLYANMLVPDLPNVRTDLKATGTKIEKDGTANNIFVLDGKEHVWESFYEPFAGDRYLKGPEFEKKAEPGTYRIEISNPGNSGKYVLAVGKTESFTFAETIHTYKVLPALKRDFFEKSPLSAYWNIVGLFIFVPLFVILFILAFLIRLAIKKRKRQ